MNFWGIIIIIKNPSFSRNFVILYQTKTFLVFKFQICKFAKIFVS